MHRVSDGGKQSRAERKRLEEIARIKGKLIVAEIKLTDIDEKYKLPRGTAGNAIHEPHVAGERAIAAALNSAAASASAADRGLRELKITVEVNGARGNREIEEMVNEGVANGVEQGLLQYDQQLPDRLAQIDADPRLR